MFQHTFFCILLLVSSLAAESSEFFLAKPGCQLKCGNVTIPYPFGMGNGCSIGDENEFGNSTGSNPYSITCDTSFNHPTAFIKANGQKFEVLSISDTEIRIRNSFTRISCIDHSGNYTENGVSHALNLNNTPFTVSYTRNDLFGIGCDVTAVGIWFSHSDSRGLGINRDCESTCESKKDMKDTFCNTTGYTCCRAAIPIGLKTYSGSVWKIIHHNDTNTNNLCNFALLAEQGQYLFNPLDITMQGFFSTYKNNVMSVVLDWAIGSNSNSCEEAQQNTKTYACRVNSYCSEVTNIPRYRSTAPNNRLTYRCTCKKGFEGNPYLESGCEDMNECEDNINNPCEEICTNTIGSYRCSCPEGKNGDGRKDGSGCSTTIGMIMRVALGVGLGGLIFTVGGILLYLSMRKRELFKRKRKFFKQNGGLLLRQYMSANENCESTKIFTSQELETATNRYNESEVLGQGGCGIVYKGTLADNRVVAIKKSKLFEQIQVEQFVNEVVILTQINHRNVVKLLGCCLETEVPLLVYEYVSSGTLFEHIHYKQDYTEMSSMTWETRLRIATETASAIAYLHSAASPPIIHRDIKSTNILLDENCTAKVSDFGASRLVPLDHTHINTLVYGTLGYLDPEYFNTSQLTDKSDVYSFGVVLAELITGEKPVCLERPEKHRNLATFFNYMIGENVLGFLDAKVASCGNLEEVLEVAEIARKCLSLKGADRPTMKQIAADLQVLRRSESFESNHKTSHHNRMMKLPSEPADLYSVPSSYIDHSSQYSSGRSLLSL